MDTVCQLQYLSSPLSPLCLTDWDGFEFLGVVGAGFVKLLQALFKFKIMRHSGVYEAFSFHVCGISVFHTITTLVCCSALCFILSLWLHSLCCDGKGSCVCWEVCFHGSGGIELHGSRQICCEIAWCAHKYVSHFLLHVSSVRWVLLEAFSPIYSQYCKSSCKPSLTGNCGAMSRI